MMPNSALAADGLQWTWEEGQHRRYYIENEVLLPYFIELASQNNHQARIVAFQMRSMLDCSFVRPANKKSAELACVIEDVGFKAAAMSSDAAAMPKILPEIDETLTGAMLQIVLRNDGRVKSVDLENVTKDNRRLSRMHETLRLLMQRSVAGLDLQLPRKGVDTGGGWLQTDSLVLQAPASVGTQGAVDIINVVGPPRDDGLILIETEGRGLISPAGPNGALDYFDTALAGVSVFDPNSGTLMERVWTSSGTPTASSALALSDGQTYDQYGRLYFLADGEKMDVGPTEQVAAPGREEGTLNSWNSLALRP